MYQASMRYLFATFAVGNVLVYQIAVVSERAARKRVECAMISLFYAVVAEAFHHLSRGERALSKLGYAAAPRTVSE